MIDPRPYEAALRAGAGATSSSPRRGSTLARKNLARAALPARANQAISQEEADTRAATRAAGRGRRRRRARGRRGGGRLDVEFTRVAAPIGGRVGPASSSTEGNLINGGVGTQGTLLTTIVSLDPIYVLLRGRRARATSSTRASRRAGDATELARRPEPGRRSASPTRTGFPHEGCMDFVDNQLDPGTGTIVGPRGRAEPRPACCARGCSRACGLPGSGRYRAIAHPRRGDRHRPGAELRLGRRRREQGAVPHGDARPARRRAPRRARGARRPTTASSSRASSACGPGIVVAPRGAPIRAERRRARRAADADARRREPATDEHLALLHRPADLRGGPLDRHRDPRRARVRRAAGRAVPRRRAADDRRARLLSRARRPRSSPRRSRRRSSRRSTASRTCSTCRRRARPTAR